MAEQGVSADHALAELTPEEAFATLGNEIRLDIIRVLWNANAAHEYDDVTDVADSLAYSELRQRAEVEDNGKFNYHLSKLVPQFVRRTDDGYRLGGAGKRIARTVIAVSGPESVDLPAELDRECPVCTGPLSVSYEDQWLRITCEDCDGLFGDMAPDGALFFTNYPAAGLADRTAASAFETGFYRCILDVASVMRDVCPECAGSITATTAVCEFHSVDTRAPCGRCGTRFPAWAEVRCESCGFAKRLPVEAYVMGLTPTIGFLDDLGIDILAPSFEEVLELLRERIETTVPDDGGSVTVTIGGERDLLEVSLAEDLTVLKLDRRSA
jgi:ribosomal protein L37E